jgi:NADH-quinone oxidoreductase subunit A
MLSDYFPLAVLTLMALVVAMIVVGLGFLFGPKRPTRIKSQPYESGMVPYGPGKQRISVRYYLVAVLFILFDIELVFFLPWAVAFRKLGTGGVVSMFIFIGVLVVGYIYAWKKGALDWE